MLVVGIACFAAATQQAEVVGRRVDLPVRVRVLHIATEAQVPVTVRAEPIATPVSPRAAAITSKITGDEGILRLAPGLWTVSAAGPEAWAWPVRVSIVGDQPPPEVRLELWRLGVVAGRLKLPSGVPKPDGLKVVVRRDYSARTEVREASLECPLVDWRFTCRLPVGSIDVELGAEGFVPVYLWDLTVPARGSRELPDTTLVRGASLVGWVLDDAGQVPNPPAKVELFGYRAAPIEQTPRARFSVATNSRGFFQVGPVPPATYEIVARQGESLSLPVRTRLRIERQEVIREPVILQTAATLRVAIVPPKDPSDGNWRLKVVGLRDGRPSRFIQETVVGESGEFSRPGLPSGQYRLTIHSSTGDKWLETDEDVGRDMTPLTLRLETLLIEGSVSMGGNPMSATVNLINRTNSTRVSFTANTDGLFSGTFPGRSAGEGPWEASVESTTPPIRRYLERLAVDRLGDAHLKVTIRLPGARLEGLVIDEVGHPYDGEAVVFAQSAIDSSSVPAAQVSVGRGEGGKFAIEGVEAGSHRLHAETRSGSQSEEVLAVASEGVAVSKTLLRLREKIVVRGRVIDRAGVGVPGAEVVAFPVESPSAAVAPSRTNGEGRFSVSLPSGSGQMIASVGALGFARAILRLKVPPTEIVPESVLVSLEEAGGTIVVDWGDQEVSTQDLYVVHGGGFEALGVLRRWASMNGGRSDGGNMFVPQMGAGFYQVCRARPSDYEALVSGGLPQDRCSGGELGIGSELRLVVPQGKSAMH